jgi:ABC-2 type transport system ATP-binding protein/lipopolysaccharide transport system ATP-binding protein
MIDEVIAVGDEEFQRRCFEHLYKLRREGVTIVLVSHAHGLLQSMCDEVAWMDHGRLMDSGDPASVIRRYLTQVNELEGARLAVAEERAGLLPTAPADPDSDEREQRLGSGEVRITRLDLLDAGGARVPVLTSGDCAVLRIHYHATSPVESPVFSIGIKHETDVHLSGTNTSMHGLRLPTVSGEGWIDYVIDRLPLLPGRYRLDASVHDEHMLHPFDQRIDFADLHVQQGSAVDDVGLVAMGGRWVAEGAAAEALEVGSDGTP